MTTNELEIELAVLKTQLSLNTFTLGMLERRKKDAALKFGMFSIVFMISNTLFAEKRQQCFNLEVAISDIEWEIWTRGEV